MCLKDVLAAFGFVKVESEADRSGDAGHSQAMTSSGTVSGRGRVRFRAIGTIVLAVKRFQGGQILKVLRSLFVWKGERVG